MFCDSQRGELINAMEAARKSKELFEAAEEPALYFSFLGAYHALFVQILVVLIPFCFVTVTTCMPMAILA